MQPTPLYLLLLVLVAVNCQDVPNQGFPPGQQPQGQQPPQEPQGSPGLFGGGASGGLNGFFQGMIRAPMEFASAGLNATRSLGDRFMNPNGGGFNMFPNFGQGGQGPLSSFFGQRGPVQNPNPNVPINTLPSQGVNQP